MRFGCKKIDVLVQRRREGQFLGESEQGAFSKDYRAHLFEFDSKIEDKETSKEISYLRSNEVL